MLHKNQLKTPTLCLFFTGNCPIKPPCCLCGHIIRSSCFIGYYYKAFQAFFCNHIIQFHDHFLLITQKINFVFFETNNVEKLYRDWVSSITNLAIGLNSKFRIYIWTSLYATICNLFLLNLIQFNSVQKLHRFQFHEKWKIS